MTYQQIRDVVKRMRTAHQQLREALERPRTRVGDARARMMLEALRQEEQELQLALGLFGARGEESLLNTWLQYVPDDDVVEALNQIEFTSDMSADEVVSRKLEFDQTLMDLLRQLSGQTAVPRVEEFFTTLLENAQSRTSQQAWSVREFQADATPPGADTES